MKPPRFETKYLRRETICKIFKNVTVFRLICLVERA